MSAPRPVSNPFFQALHSTLRAINRWRESLAPTLHSALRAIDRWRAWFGPAVRSALQALKRGRDRLAARPSFGITSRLMIAFLGVGALLLAANFFVEENVLVEKTTQITRIAAAPAPAPSIPQPVIEPPRAVIVQRRVVTSEPLMSDLDRFERAAQSRATTKTDESETEYQQSSSDLDTATRAFVTQAASISGKSFQKLSSGIDDYRTHAAQVVLMA